MGLCQGDRNVDPEGRSPGEQAGGLEQGEPAGGEGMKRMGDDERGWGTDSGKPCVWRRCLVKERTATEGPQASDVAVVVEWNDEVGGQVR